MTEYKPLSSDASAKKHPGIELKWDGGSRRTPKRRSRNARVEGDASLSMFKVPRTCRSHFCLANVSTPTLVLGPSR